MQCCLTAAKSSPQLFAVMRHSERLDFADEDAWYLDPSSDVFPSDAPITARGWEIARKSGEELQRFCDSVEASIDLIVSSPYHRCVQTAIALQDVLLSSEAAERIPILLDVEVGEVNLHRRLNFPCDEDTRNAYDTLCKRRRTFREVLSLADLANVELLNEDSFVGRHPSWPERRRDAHIRGLYRFAEWIERGRRLQMNICVVTHQDLTHVFCATIKPEISIDWIPYCGWGAVTFRNARRRFGKPRRKQDLIHDDVEGNAAPQPIHKLQTGTAKLSTGVCWTAHGIDARTGAEIRWRPHEDETDCAAEAARFANGDTRAFCDFDTYSVERSMQRTRTYELLLKKAKHVICMPRTSKQEAKEAIAISLDQMSYDSTLVPFSPRTEASSSRFSRFSGHSGSDSDSNRCWGDWNKENTAEGTDLLCSTDLKVEGNDREECLRGADILTRVASRKMTGSTILPRLSPRTSPHHKDALRAPTTMAL